jgi:nickel/cobalt transporter (NicO) family protein
MDNHFGILILTTATVAFLHTLLGPDHYVPFIAISKASGWSRIKTIRITILSGLGHILSSVLLGLLVILFGTALNKIDYIESVRGDFAGWLLISFGLIYFIWGIRRAMLKKTHIHLHTHVDGEVHLHEHAHSAEHTHLHPEPGKSNLTPWIMFIIFFFGPCEPLIPLILYPALSHDIMLTTLVILIFTLITTGTMLVLVLAGLKGLEFVPFRRVEKYSFAAAGLLVLLCGVSIKFLGL